MTFIVETGSLLHFGWRLIAAHVRGQAQISDLARTTAASLVQAAPPLTRSDVTPAERGDHLLVQP
jgi:hypothetical protein